MIAYWRNQTMNFDQRHPEGTSDRSDSADWMTPSGIG